MYVVGFELKLKCTVQSGINMANDKHKLKLYNHSNTVVHASCPPCCHYSSHDALIFLYIPATPFIGCMLSALFATLITFLISITNITSCHMAVKFTIIIIIIIIITSNTILYNLSPNHSTICGPSFRRFFLKY